MNEIVNIAIGLTVVAFVLAAMGLFVFTYQGNYPELGRALQNANAKIDDLYVELDATEELLLDLSMREHAARKEVEDLRHQLERFMRPRDARGRFIGRAA